MQKKLKICIFVVIINLAHLALLPLPEERMTFPDSQYHQHSEKCCLGPSLFVEGQNCLQPSVSGSQSLSFIYRFSKSKIINYRNVVFYTSPSSLRKRLTFIAFLLLNISLNFYINPTAVYFGHQT